MTLKDIFHSSTGSWLVHVLLVVCGIALGRWMFQETTTVVVSTGGDSMRVIVQAEVAKQSDEIRMKLEELRAALLNRQPLTTRVTIADTTTFNRRIDSLLSALISGDEVEIEVGSGVETFPNTSGAADSVVWAYYGRPLSIASIELRRAPSIPGESLWGGLFVETGAYAQIGEPFKPLWGGLTVYPELHFGEWSLLPKLTLRESQGLGGITIRYRF